MKNRFVISIFLFISFLNARSQVNFHDFTRANSIENKLDLAHELWEFYSRNYPDSLKYVASDLMEFGNQRNSISAKMFAKRVLGCYLVRNGDYKAGERELKIALNYDRRNQDKANETEDLNELGNSNFLKGDYHSAESFFKLSLSSGKESPDETHAFLAELNLAKTYDKMGLKDRAKELAKSFLIKSKKLNKRESVSKAYGFLGDIALVEKNIPLAKEYMQQSLYSSSLSKNKLFLAQSYSNIAAFYATVTEFDSAKFYFEKSLFVQTQNKNKKGIVEAIFNLGYLNFIQNNYEDAENQFKNGLKIAIKNRFIIDQIDFLEMLVEVFRETKNNEMEKIYLVQFSQAKAKQNELIEMSNFENQELINYFEDSNKYSDNNPVNSNFWTYLLVIMLGLLSATLTIHFLRPRIATKSSTMYE